MKIMKNIQKSPMVMEFYMNDKEISLILQVNILNKTFLWMPNERTTMKKDHYVYKNNEFSEGACNHYIRTRGYWIFGG